MHSKTIEHSKRIDTETNGNDCKTLLCETSLNDASNAMYAIHYDVHI